MTIFFPLYNNADIWSGKSNKRKFYASRKPIKIWDVNADNIVIS